MSNHGGTQDPDIKPMHLIGGVIGGVVVGAVIGFLICHCMSKDEAAKQGITDPDRDQAAIYQPYEVPDPLV